MKKKLIFAGLILVLVAAVLTACTKPAPTPTPTPKPSPSPSPSPTATPTPKPTPTPTPTATQDKFTLTVASNAGTSIELLAWNPPGNRFANMVKERSGGRLTLDIKLNMMDDTQIPIAVSEGRIDMGRFYNGLSSGTFPLWDYQSLPFFWEISPPGFYAYERASNDPRVVEILDRTYKDKGMIYLAQTPKHIGTGQLYGFKHIKTLAEFQGAKIRATGLMVNWAMEAAGAKPTTITGQGVSVPEALSKGLVDFAIGDRSFHVSVGTHLVATHVSVWPFAPIFTSTVVINPKKWAELPPDLQKILKDSSLELGRQIAYAAEVSELVALKAIEAAKVQIFVPTDAQIQEIRQVTQPVVIDKWLKVAGPDAPKLLSIISEYAGGALKK